MLLIYDKNVGMIAHVTYQRIVSYEQRKPKLHMRNIATIDELFYEKILGSSFNIQGISPNLPWRQKKIAPVNN
jgi:hypothetical protein